MWSLIHSQQGSIKHQFCLLTTRRCRRVTLIVSNVIGWNNTVASTTTMEATNGCQLTWLTNTPTAEKPDKVVTNFCRKETKEDSICKALTRVSNALRRNSRILYHCFSLTCENITIYDIKQLLPLATYTNTGCTTNHWMNTHS